MTAPHQHADLDALADALAAEDDGTPLPAELTGCATCSTALADLRAALGAVADDLARLPAVPEVPAGLGAAPGSATGATTVLPASVTSLQERRAPRWLAPAGGLAAAAVLVVGGGLLLTRGSTDSRTASRSSKAGSALAVSDSGTRYSRTSLATAVPGLLKAKKESLDDAAKAPAAAPMVGGSTAGPAGGKTVTGQSADPMARLRTTSGLAACLAGLSGPGESSLPLAVDYGSFEGRPAMVVVLPSSRTSKLDVFVVGAACNQTEQDVLYYLHADRPQG